MGLAGRKVKQRIGADPRNLTWADDASKFGSKYLQSLGWTSGTGLGASGEGRVSHLTVHQKLDLMGIGANRKGTDEAAWSGGREYEGLLSRLNEAQAQNSRVTSEGNADRQQGDPKEEVEEFAEKAMEVVEEKSSRESKKQSKQKRKRAVDEADDDIDYKEAKKRRKEEKRARKEEKEREKKEKKEKKAAKKLKQTQKHAKFQVTSSAVVVQPTTSVEESVEITDIKVRTTVTPMFRPHRARHLASKRMAAASEKAMNEILGISTSLVAEETSVAVPPSPNTQIPSLLPETAGISIRDRVVPVEKGDEDEEEAARLPAMGLGSTGFAFGGGLGFYRTKKEQPPQEQRTKEDGLFCKNEMNLMDYFAEKLRQKQCRVEPVIETKIDNNGEVKVKDSERKKSRKDRSTRKQS